MATKEDVLKVLFPAGIPVDRLKDLPAILHAAENAAAIAAIQADEVVVLKNPQVVLDGGLLPDVSGFKPKRNRSARVGFANPEIKRKADESRLLNAKQSQARKMEAVLEHLLLPKTHFHSTSWFVRRFELSYRDVVRCLLGAIEAKRIELYDGEGNVLTTLEQFRHTAWRARRPLAQLTLAPAASIVEPQVIAVEDHQVQKVLQYIQDGDKTVQDVSKHFHYSPGFVEQLLKTAHTQFGFKFNRDAGDTLSIVFIPPTQVASAV